jgi:hypothetical protein
MLRVRWPVTASAHHVAGSGATQVVEQSVGDPGSLAGGSPGPAEVTYRFTVSMEHHRGDSKIAILL